MNSSKSLARSDRIRRSASEWQHIIAQYEQSDQTQETFCHEHSLALSTFCRWRQRLSRLTSPSTCEAPGFVELSSEVPADEPALTSWDVELQLGADVFLRLRRC